MSDDYEDYVEDHRATPDAVTPPALYDLWRSGFVNRWHTHPHPGLRNGQDMTSGHSWRVAVLVTMISANSPHTTKDELLSLVMAALFHDADELVTGDMAHPAKKKMPEVAQQLRDFGKDWLHERSVPDFGTNALLQMCDRLDAYLMMCQNAHDLMGNVKWTDMREDIIDAAIDLGCVYQVTNLIKIAEAREWF